MMHSRMDRAWIHEMRHAHLFDMTQPLKPRMRDYLHYLTLRKTQETIYRIINDFDFGICHNSLYGVKLQAHGRSRGPLFIADYWALLVLAFLVLAAFFLRLHFCFIKPWCVTVHIRFILIVSACTYTTGIQPCTHFTVRIAYVTVIKILWLLKLHVRTNIERAV